MADSFRLKIYHPAGLLLDKEVEEAVLPANTGEIGILPQHISYTGLLGTGVLRYRESGSSEEQQIIISSGFCDYTEEAFIVLADAAELPEDINREQYDKNRQEIEEKVKNLSSGDPEWQYAKDQLDRIHAIDSLIAH